MNETIEKINIKELTSSNDLVFKAIMLDHPIILKSILETLMKKKIKSLRILNSELPKRQFLEKGKRLDAYLESSDEYIDVEVSTSYTKATVSRNISYACHIYCSAIKVGDDYTEYKKTTIFNLIWGTKSKYLNTHASLKDEYGKIVSDMLQYNSFYMDKCMERYYNEDIKFINEYKYLIMLGLKIEELDKLIEITNGDEIVKEYKKTLEQVLSDDELTTFIEPEKDREMLLKGSIKAAKQEGIEQVANNLIKQGLDLESISKATGLTIERLKQLQ